MKNLLLSSAAVVALSGAAYAQDADAIQGFIDSGIEGLNQEGANITFESREVGSDNSLELRGVRIAPEDGEVIITTDWIKVTPSAETPGDVTMTIAPLVTILGAPGEEEEVEISFASEGFALTANWVASLAGKPAARLVAESLSITGGREDHPVLKRLDFSPENLEVSFSFDEETRNADAALAMSALKLDYKFADPGADVVVESQVDTSEIAATFTGRNLPMDEDDFERFVAEDGSFRFTTEGGGSTTRFSSTDPNMPMTLSASGGSGSAEISFENGEFLYLADFGAVDYQVALDPNVMPLPPFDISLAGGDMEMRVPVRPNGGTQKAKLAISFRELAVSDAVWAMFDPEATIPRDPATLEIDITADMALKQALTALEDADDPLEVGQVDEVAVNRIYLTLGGATAEAMGGATIDYSGFLPMPEGAIDISIEGVQTLVQSLVALGVVPQDQAGMMLGMMMAYAKPGDGPDSFTSKIEFKEGGVFANGQPLQ